MSYLFCSQSLGFFRDTRHNRALLPHAVVVTHDDREQLLAGEANGNVIGFDGRHPVLLDRQENTLDEDKQHTVSGIEHLFKKAMQSLRKPYSDAEASTWPLQHHEALLLRADHQADAPFLRHIADANNDDVAALAENIINKANAYARQQAAYLGLKRQWIATIQACDSKAQLNQLREDARVAFK